MKQTGWTQQLADLSPIESPAFSSAGSDDLAVVPQSQSEKGPRRGRLVSKSGEYLGTTIFVKVGLETGLESCSSPTGGAVVQAGKLISLAGCGDARTAGGPLGPGCGKREEEGVQAG